MPTHVPEAFPFSGLNVILTSHSWIMRSFVTFTNSSNDIRVISSRKMRWVRHIARMGETRNPHTILIGKLEWKRPFGRPGRRWVDNIRMNVREIRLEIVD
jgi:hypothetical protein